MPVIIHHIPGSLIVVCPCIGNVISNSIESFTIILIVHNLGNATVRDRSWFKEESHLTLTKLQRTGSLVQDPENNTL